MSRTFDLICLGRAAVDLYGQQFGGRLEDMQSFAKYLGGSSANVAAGTSRLGVRSSMLTRVGDEHMGRFVREALQREGVDVGHVRTDPERLTALVILGIAAPARTRTSSIRENCADMGVSVEDFDEAYIASSGAFAVTGTHLSTDPERGRRWNRHFAGRAPTRRAPSSTSTIGRCCGSSPLPVDGDSRYVVVRGGHGGAAGTVAVVRSGGGHRRRDPDRRRRAGRAGGAARDSPAHAGAHRAEARCERLRRSSKVTCPPRSTAPCRCRALPVEVLNVLGAGDAFLSGLLYGWLGGKSLAESARLGNACGALVVSRHGCTPGHAEPSGAGRFHGARRRHPATRPR